MRRPRLSEFALAMALKLVLDRIGHGQTSEAVTPSRRTAGSAALDRSRGESSRSRPLAAFMFASLAVALVLMLVFHAAVTRVIGVVAIFAFIVSGVFLIADPASLVRNRTATALTKGSADRLARPRPGGGTWARALESLGTVWRMEL